VYVGIVLYTSCVMFNVPVFFSTSHFAASHGTVISLLSPVETIRYSRFPALSNTRSSTVPTAELFWIIIFMPRTCLARNVFEVAAGCPAAGGSAATDRPGMPSSSAANTVRIV